MTTDRAPAPAISPRLRRPAPVALVAAGALTVDAILFALFMTVVRAEPRWDLAAGALLLLAAAALVVTGVRWAPALALPVGLAVLDRVQVYVPFSLERPDDLAGVLFSAACLVSVGIGAVAGPLATWNAYRPPARGATGVSVVGGVALAAGMAVVFAGAAEPDQGRGLSRAEVAELPVVVMDDYTFTPSRLDVAAGEETAVRLVNDDTETYSFVVDELGVSVTVPSGREAVVRLRADAPGPLAFYSAEEAGEHRELGMEGVLVAR